MGGTAAAAAAEYQFQRCARLASTMNADGTLSSVLRFAHPYYVGYVPFFFVA